MYEHSKETATKIQIIRLLYTKFQLANNYSILSSVRFNKQQKTNHELLNSRKT